MSLAQDIRALQKRTLADLGDSHDYYTYTKRVWNYLRDHLKQGEKLAFRNLATGSRRDEKALLGMARDYVARYLLPGSFQHFVSLFEDFFFDLLRLWLTAYPASLSRKPLEFGTVLKSVDKDAIVQSVIDKELNESKYGRVTDWFADLDKLVKLGCPTADEIERFAEIKASRDILVHGKGVANATYLSKAGSHARYKDGELMEIPEPYHRESWELIRKMVGDLSEAAISKA